MRKYSKAKLKQINYLIYRDGPNCHLCGKEVLINCSVQNSRAATVDHIIPKVNGGSLADSNLALAHKKCNSKRGHKILVPTTRCPVCDSIVQQDPLIPCHNCMHLRSA